MNINPNLSARITWTCELCRQPVDDGEGRLVTEYVSRGGESEEMQYRVLHYVCDEWADSVAGIPVEEVRSYRGVVEWSARLIQLFDDRPVLAAWSRVLEAVRHGNHCPRCGLPVLYLDDHHRLRHASEEADEPCWFEDACDTGFPQA